VIRTHSIHIYVYRKKGSSRNWASNSKPCDHESDHDYRYGATQASCAKLPVLRLAVWKFRENW